MPSTPRHTRAGRARRPARSVRPWRRHLLRAVGEERNGLGRPVDRARSRALVLAAVGIGAAALAGAGVAVADLTTAHVTAHVTADAVCLGLFTLGGLAVLLASGLGLRLRTLDRRADRAWTESWAALEPMWSGRAARRPGTDDTRRP